eukprot:TRINITY_DN10986_c0_g1_i2.p1 TRINITY_DN10986_c0_g1~~TRINITY_DN10986_c0_g1_i2.p1  ORF type:complete len:384 (-),score=65.12 TRINITY_DN10986_c0_g1_i2:53-1204(-)
MPASAYYSGKHAQRSLKYTSYVCVTPSNILGLLKQPKFYVALAIAIPCGIIGGGLKYVIKNYYDPAKDPLRGLINTNEVYNTLSFLVVFLAAFRLAAAYTKFWSGADFVYSIIGDLFDSASDLISYNRGAAASAEEIDDFQQLIIRLFSLLNSLIFAELEAGSDRMQNGSEHDMNDAALPKSYDFDLIDVNGISDEYMDKLINCPNKVELVFTWVQMVIVDGWHKKLFSVPPPVLSRAMSDLGTAVVHFHEAQKITEVPFPFPYMMALQLLLTTHWWITPIVMQRFTELWYWAFLFSFGTQFSLWFLLGLAMELDQPFQHTRNSVDMRYLQRLLNHRLLTITDTFKFPSPHLKKPFKQNLERNVDDMAGSGKALLDIVSTKSM